MDKALLPADDDARRDWERIVSMMN